MRLIKLSLIAAEIAMICGVVLLVYFGDMSVSGIKILTILASFSAVAFQKEVDEIDED